MLSHLLLMPDHTMICGIKIEVGMSGDKVGAQINLFLLHIGLQKAYGIDPLTGGNS